MTRRRSAFGYGTVVYNRNIGSLDQKRLERIDQYLDEYLQHLQTLPTDHNDKINDVKQLLWVVQNEHRCFR
jgi:hypothetical protein